MPADATLSAQVAAFCTVLREDFGFHLGVAETRDALLAIELAQVAKVDRFRAALRAVCCGSRAELDTFERAFDAFFSLRRKIAIEENVEQRWLTAVRSDEPRDTEPAWDALLAKYSAAAAQAEPPQADPQRLAAYSRIVDAMIASVRLGRSRRWKPRRSGARFDLRRTLRASLHTGGEPIYVRRLAHPLRNPRFVVLLDGSRSMAERAPDMLAFAFALLRRTLRARIFAFSTELREITYEMRRGALHSIGEAWGGGTRLGDALQRFVRRYGSLVDDDTVVLAFSDGLDFGEPAILGSAAAELARRSAALVWLAPNASRPDYVPATQGMRAVRPHLTALLDSNDPSALARIGSRF